MCGDDGASRERRLVQPVLGAILLPRGMMYAPVMYGAKHNANGLELSMNFFNNLLNF